MKHLILICAMILCLLPLAGWSEEMPANDFSMTMACFTGVSDHVAFSLPGSAAMVPDADYPGMFEGSRQLAGTCSEDGAEFQLRSGNIAQLIETIREEILAEMPEATEDIIRINALFSYAMMMPGQMGAELLSTVPHGIRGKDWLWIEATFTYPDAPGLTYDLKAMLTGTQATTLVMCECDHTQDVLDALRFVDDDALAEIEAVLNQETSLDFYSLSLTFPREAMVIEQESFVLAGTFAADWARLQAEFLPYAFTIDVSEEEQLQAMTALGKKAVSPYQTDRINDPVLSHPAPDMLQLDFWTIDETNFGEYGTRVRARVYAGERGVWYVLADEGESGARFLNAMYLTDTETSEPAILPLPADAAVEPAATLPEFKANLALLAPDLLLNWSAPIGSGGEWVSIGFLPDAGIGGVRVSLASASEQAAIREIRIVAYDRLDTDGLRLASLCAQALGGQPASIARPTAAEAVTEAGAVRISAQHLSREDSALVYDRVILTPETVPPLLEEIVFPEGESLVNIENGPTLAEVKERLERLQGAFLPEEYKLLELGGFFNDEEPCHAWLVHNGIGAILYLDGEEEDARVHLIAVIGLDGDAPGVLGTTMLFYAIVHDLSDAECASLSYLLIESPLWEELADLWPLMAQGNVCAFLQESGEPGEDWIPLGFVSGMPDIRPISESDSANPME